MRLLSRFLLTFLLVFSLSPCFSAWASGAAKKEGADKPADGEPVYVHLKPIVLPIISDYGAEQLVNLIIDLEMKDFETATMLDNNKPRLHDAIIRGLYGGLADGSMRNASALNIPKIKKKIRDVVNETFGEGSVKDVLFQDIAQRKL